MVKFLQFVLVFHIFIVAHLHAKTIHSERSHYRNILVTEKSNLRCLRFNVKSKLSQQSCQFIDKPEQLVFSYTKLLFSSLLVNPEPKRVLIIGLGGGTMSNTLYHLFPNIKITNVEIDPAVIKVARKYFDFIENPQITSHVKDGRIFVKRALLQQQKYDWIILDAFNGDYIPEHLLTQEFLQETKQLLSEDGVLTANTFSTSQLYNYESATYYSVFGDFFNVRKEQYGNRIILTSKQPLPDNALVKKRAKQLTEQLAKFNINIRDIAKQLVSTKEKKDWPDNNKILTDQYSPANLLNAQ